MSYEWEQVSCECSGDFAEWTQYGPTSWAFPLLQLLHSDVMHFPKFLLATPQYLLEDLSQDLDQFVQQDVCRSLQSMGDELSIGIRENVTVSYEGGEFILNHSKSLGQRVIFRISNYLETIHRVFIYYKLDYVT